MDLKLGLLIATLMMALVACKKSNAPKSAPPCMVNKILVMSLSRVANPPASVWRYEYDGKTVYYIPPACCDQSSQLYDNLCHDLCSPDGGFSGGGDGKCPDFFAKRTQGVLIWQDHRK